MDNTLVILEIDAHDVAFVTFNRPEVHNAFNAETIDALYRVFEHLHSNERLRLVVLSGNGKSFCAGGDLHWMKSMKDFSERENLEDSMHLARMFASMARLAMPVIGVVQGFALGGGSGLASLCDYVIASEEAIFGFTETRLGLVPATISPYVIEKIGISAARAYFLSGARFSADIAKDIGLIHKITPSNQLIQTRDETIAEFLKAAPHASRKAKAMIKEVVRLSHSDTIQLNEYTAHTIAHARISEEGQEGLAALLEGIAPVWVDKP